MKIRLQPPSWAALIPVAILIIGIGTTAEVGGAGVSAQSAPVAQSGPGTATRNAAPFVPQPILPGGQIVTLFPPDSPYLHKDRIGEPEQNNLQKTVPGRIQSIVNIHNPSIEVHVVDPGNNTGAAIILAPGGGPQHAQRRHRRGGLRLVLLQFRRHDDHPEEPASTGRLRSTDR